VEHGAAHRHGEPHQVRGGGTGAGQPQLRITEGQKGSLVIANQEPIPTTTFNTSQTIGGNIVPITAFQYKDVGIKIEA